ncbi:hypothetical protein ATPR_3297 [Acetobacter tropicalis NBRC 101654]|uniref:Uncharacterized protein n=1 Tax=Acetobacter tropicalis NBRC 101654 TaxID=749388 RepID=F7VIU8_9PROT|nr:hypothetical protein ATPR_3297 [Acetobacter tropicalis NBRC 101654]
MENIFNIVLFISLTFCRNPHVIWSSSGCVFFGLLERRGFFFIVKA